MEITTEKVTLHPAIQRLFKKRELTPEQVQELFSWDLKSLPDLTILKDIPKSSERIIKAIKNKEKIGIFGDYDVDGTTSCALFWHFFNDIGVEVELIQPSRFKEGYGLHPPSIDDAIEKGIDLLITVDCGITNCEAADYAKSRGLDLIITDHHLDGRDVMPDAYAIINPSRRDEEDLPIEFKGLAGVGVAFALCLQLKKDIGEGVPSLYPLLQFVALGTVCDLAPLNSINIKLVRHGLHQMRESTFPGLRCFFTHEERLNPIGEEKLGFNIGPMINSKGRLDHPEVALKLLIEQDQGVAYHYHGQLNHCNLERKKITNEIFDQAKTQVLKKMTDNHLISIVYKESFHEGVIGIVASKLVEFFKVPAIVFTDAEKKGIVKASARTAGSFDLFSGLNSLKDLFEKFGGHKAAAGLSMKKENLPAFKTRMKEHLASIPEIERTNQETYDLEVFPEDINPKLVKDLEKIGPFGKGNEKPIFKMKGVYLDSFDLLKDVHVRWNFSTTTGPKRRFRGISFNYIGKWGHLSPEVVFNMQKGENLSIYFTLTINRFKGNEYLQLMVSNVTIGDMI
ncbi:MAG: single-stranded-DNA-specific exonuclease RecJ [Epsilonproteobacteria bacterium]|nr:MAG: single-stranded-DNA-specific exonuclease RecJ [Campylobacterota bacterium]RLA64268.1 MAG: single-stranded-DNA-specific exonuclease RecJ [Campylobacterota bacterium]